MNSCCGRDVLLPGAGALDDLQAQRVVVVGDGGQHRADVVHRHLGPKPQNRAGRTSVRLRAARDSRKREMFGGTGGFSTSPRAVGKPAAPRIGR